MQIWLSPDGFSAVAAELNGSEIFSHFSLYFIDDFKMLIKESGLLDWTRRLWPSYLAVVFFFLFPSHLSCLRGHGESAGADPQLHVGEAGYATPGPGGSLPCPRASSALRLVPATSPATSTHFKFLSPTGAGGAAAIITAAVMSSEAKTLIPETS